MNVQGWWWKSYTLTYKTQYSTCGTSFWCCIWSAIISNMMNLCIETFRWNACTAWWLAQFWLDFNTTTQEAPTNQTWIAIQPTEQNRTKKKNKTKKKHTHKHIRNTTMKQQKDKTFRATCEIRMRWTLIAKQSIRIKYSFGIFNWMWDFAAV